MESLYKWIVARAWWIIAATLLATVFFGWEASRITVDSSVEALLPQDDPERQYNNEIRKLYGSDEIGFIGVLADDVYQPAVLQKIGRLTDDIAKVEGVAKVLSLTNVPDPVADVVAPPLVPKIPTNAAESAELRKKLADRPLYRKTFVSDDGRAAAVDIFFEEMDDDEFARRGIDQKIEAIVEAARGPEEIHYTGLPHMKVYTANALWRDLVRFVPVTLAMIVVVLLFCFRSVRGVTLPALTVLVSLTWTLGIMVLAGSHLTLGTTSLPPLVLVIGTAYSLHVLAEYYELAEPDRSMPEVVLETLRRVGPPSLIAALTTVIGFASIAVNRIPSIRAMGVYSAIGITLAFVLSVVLLPACLALMPPPRGRGIGDFAPGLAAFLRRIGETAVRRRREMILGSLAVTALALLPMPWIRVDSNFQSFFRADDPIRRATDAVNAHLAGSAAFYVAIDGHEKNVLKTWDTLRRIKELQTFIDALPGSREDGLARRPPGAVRPRKSASRAGQPRGRAVRRNRRGGGAGREDDVLGKPRSARSRHQVHLHEPESPRERGDGGLLAHEHPRRDEPHPLERHHRDGREDPRVRRRPFSPELDVRPTGTLILLTKTTGSIIAGQIESLALTAGIIFVIMAAMFLSFRVGLIAMVPNVFPIVVFFGFMGLIGADLNLATNMVASIALGIAVDDTIHILSRLSSEVRATGDQKRALLETLSTVGKPALFASALIFLGFLTLCLSMFVPIQQFGMLSAATMAFALAGELVLTPALLSTTRIITLWDLLYLRLGKDPHKTIGIFQNLGPWQAKIVALMGELRSFRAGEPIIREGETGDAMYVLIDGTAEVRVQVGGKSRTVRTVRRGDVFGEMGLIRRHERTADVVAVENVEVMSMDERFLARVKRRYPRIALKFLTNIARILSDHLQRQTDETRSLAAALEERMAPPDAEYGDTAVIVAARCHAGAALGARGRTPRSAPARPRGPRARTLHPDDPAVLQ